LSALRNDYQAEKLQNEKAGAQVNQLHTELTELNTRLDAERSQAQDKLSLLLEAKEALSNQFKSLANDILEKIQAFHRAESDKYWPTPQSTERPESPND
jgi:DNA recombination protein RmuC